MCKKEEFPHSPLLKLTGSGKQKNEENFHVNISLSYATKYRGLDTRTEFYAMAFVQ